MKFETIMTFEYILAMEETPNILVIGEKCIPCMCETVHYGDRVGITIECKFLPDKSFLMDLINNQYNITVNGKDFYLSDTSEKFGFNEHYIEFKLISKKSINKEMQVSKYEKNNFIDNSNFITMWMWSKR